MKTYFVPKMADGSDIPPMQRKLGTPAYGYASIATARKMGSRYGAAYVQTRYFDGSDDWSESEITPL